MSRQMCALSVAKCIVLLYNGGSGTSATFQCTYCTCSRVLQKGFMAVCDIMKLKTEHIWPGDLALESVRHTCTTSLYNDPHGRNILQRKGRGHQKPAMATVNTIMAYKLSAVFFFSPKQLIANGTPVLRNILLRGPGAHLNRSTEMNLFSWVFLVLLVPVSITTGITEAEKLSLNAS